MKLSDENLIELREGRFDLPWGEEKDKLIIQLLAYIALRLRRLG